MDIRDVPVDYGNAIDFGDLIVHECPLCGSNMFKIIAWFEESEIVGYTTDAECFGCSSRFKAPTLADEYETQ
jgi:hypothetical protein